MHEFEGLLFSDCAAFAQSIGHPELEPELQQIREGFETPEDINDSPATAPSKRISDLARNYQKPLFGSLAAKKIGLARITQECQHFARWIQRLEQLAGG